MYATVPIFVIMYFFIFTFHSFAYTYIFPLSSDQKMEKIGVIFCRVIIFPQ